MYVVGAVLVGVVILGLLYVALASSSGGKRTGRGNVAVTSNTHSAQPQYRGRPLVDDILRKSPLAQHSATPPHRTRRTPPHHTTPHHTTYHGRSAARPSTHLRRMGCACAGHGLSADSEREWSASEVSRHCTAGDLWLVVDGRVYDVTDFVDEHPGGVDAIMKRPGLDNSAGFHGPQHPEKVSQLIGEYFIGRLAAQ